MAVERDVRDYAVRREVGSGSFASDRRCPNVGLTSNYGSIDCTTANVETGQKQKSRFAAAQTALATWGILRRARPLAAARRY